MSEYLWVEKYRPQKIEDCILTEELKKTFNLNLKYPSVYRLAKTLNDFIWLRKDVKSGSLNLMIYVTLF